MRKLVLVLLTMPLAAGADVITYDFEWLGNDGYSMVGFFAYDDSNAADGAIRDEEVQSLFFEGLLNGVSIASSNAANLAADFNFNFDTVAGQFFLNGNSRSDSGQRWNIGGTGLGFAAGFAASLLILNQDAVGRIENPAPLTATIRPPASVPEPGTLALLATGLFGLALARRRKAAQVS